MERILSWVEINLDAIDFNIRQFCRHVGPNVEVIAVVKANAYGHGAEPVARTALQAGAARLAVHRVHEGVGLRQAGIQAPVLIMGYTPPEAAQAVVDYRLTPSLITLEFAGALSGLASATGIEIPVHIKIDSGMSRYGLMPDETLDFVRRVRDLPGISMEGIFTHFATADWADQSHMRQQLKVFQDVLSACEQTGFSFPLVHACNSAAAMKLPEAHFNAIRPGIAIYGMSPSSEWPPVFEIRPALALKSRVSRVRWLSQGAGVSYGRTHITEKATQAALVPVGYGDGYPRSLSNRGWVLVGGQRAPVLGRVCMDQFVVDVSHIKDVRQDDEVVLIGRQEQGEIRAEEVADWAGTINYEITTALLPRLPRVYFN